MKEQFRKGQLLSYYDQIERWRNGWMIEYYLNFGKIRQFLNDYGIRIQTLQEERFNLMCEYHVTEMQKDQQGNEFRALVWNVDEQGRRQGYKFKDGVDPQEFQKRFNEWWNSPVTSIITPAGPVN